VKRLLTVFGYARRLFWLLELLVDPALAANALLNQRRVRSWLERQPPEDRQKIQEAAPLVIGAILASLD